MSVPPLVKDHEHPLGDAREVLGASGWHPPYTFRNCTHPACAYTEIWNAAAQQFVPLPDSVYEELATQHPEPPYELTTIADILAEMNAEGEAGT